MGEKLCPLAADFFVWSVEPEKHEIQYSYSDKNYTAHANFEGKFDHKKSSHFIFFTGARTTKHKRNSANKSVYRMLKM